MGLYENYGLKEWLIRANTPGTQIAVTVICPECLKPIAPEGSVSKGNCQHSVESPGDILSSHGLENSGLMVMVIVSQDDGAGIAAQR